MNHKRVCCISIQHSAFSIQYSNWIKCSFDCNSFIKNLFPLVMGYCIARRRNWNRKCIIQLFNYLRQNFNWMIVDSTNVYRSTAADTRRPPPTIRFDSLIWFCVSIAYVPLSRLTAMIVNVLCVCARAFTSNELQVQYKAILATERIFVVCVCVCSKTEYAFNRACTRNKSTALNQPIFVIYNGRVG